MGALPLVFTSGWASGVNAYATVLVLGLLGRFAGFGDVPQALQRTDVLIIAGILALVEFFADKIPYVDSVWDTISTVIRPVAGAVIGALMANAQGDLVTITLASVGGLTALVSHLVRASLRLAINTSPEPASNIAASAGGEVAVVGMTTFAVLNPIPAAIVAGILLIIGIVLAVLAARQIRRGWRRLRHWRERRAVGPPA
ncbi:DUF4126 domain-containing protein [Naumannella cuiyingiana]|uniref:DUF4126 domain-containing protein n=1 Tax=Naumannella cuiyingiana TaxID=1347891 RepID=A0A7Z0DB47_9ACTN|nr:DUF4126 domain-containing protein [Naumannella cuiyingiana]NYI72076.1 hypothetical protein [Naumannella cuiyingiana]